jgi:ribonuclease HII
VTPARKRLRLKDPLRYERGWWNRGITTVAGADEVGRGPLAGPVVAAAVVLPPDLHLVNVADSKMLTADARSDLARLIRARAAAIGIGAGSAREIDRLGIVPATRLAFHRALVHLGPEPGHLVIDGRPVKDLGWKHAGVVKADYRVHCVACASIVAKVCRDELMDRLDRRYPQYGWKDNKGYGTADHRDALARFGPSPHHRMSFAGVAAPVRA